MPRFGNHFDTQRDIVGSAQRLRGGGSESPHEARLGDRGGDKVLRNEGEGGHAQAVSLQRRHLWINQLEKVRSELGCPVADVVIAPSIFFQESWAARIIRGNSEEVLRHVQHQQGVNR